jgi:hypothetical protein
MGDSCPVCGGMYVYGPGGRSHAACNEVGHNRGLVDEAVAWVMSDDPDKGPMPPLVARLREQCLTGSDGCSCAVRPEST